MTASQFTTIALVVLGSAAQIASAFYFWRSTRRTNRYRARHEAEIDALTAEVSADFDEMRARFTPQPIMDAGAIMAQYCPACGAYLMGGATRAFLMGGATRHAPDCEFLAAIEARFPQTPATKVN